MKNKLKSLNVKKILSLSMCLMLVLNLGVSNYFVQEVSAVISDDVNRELTVNDIPDSILLNKLTELADINKDGKLIISELKSYTGDSNGLLDLSNLELTNITGLVYAKAVKAIDLRSNNQLSYIPKEAFYNCTSLVSIILPDNITSIEVSAFEGCNSLSDINLPNRVTNIGEKSFKDCTSLANITLPLGILNIGNSAFSNSGLTSIEITNPNVKIGVSCFNGSVNLKNVTLPEGMESIPMECFKATGISTITIPKSINSIEGAAFADSKLMVLDLSMNTSLTSIKLNAFAGTLLIKIKLPESLTELGAGAFENCSYLPEINIPSKITVINQLTFKGCGNLKKLTFTPSGIVDGVTNYNLEEIKPLAFSQCTGLGGAEGNVDFLKDLNKLSTIGEQAFMYCSLEVKNVKDEYGQQVYYGIQSIILPESLSTIGKGAFSNCNTLKSIVIPKKVTVIEDNTFLNCYNLENVTLSNATTSIGVSSFELCKSLNNITFPESLTKIGNNAFLNCANEKAKTIVKSNIKEYTYTGFDTLILPDGLTDIGIGAFKGCYNLKSVMLPVKLNSLSDGVFQDCGRQLRDSAGNLIDGSYIGLKSVIFPDNLASIGVATFKNCYNLDLVDGALPNSISTIGANSFESCKSLTSVVIPNSLNTISASVFYNCNSLQEVDFTHSNENLKSIGANAFYKSGIQGILSFPEKLTEIGSSAFQGCDDIVSVNFPDGLKTIGNSSFKDCLKLKGITIPASVKIIYSEGNASFYGCNVFTNIFVKAVPKDIILMENSSVILPVNCFTKIDSVKMGDENIATAQIDSLSNQKVSLNGVVTGKTTITIEGTIEYIAGKDPVSGSSLVNRFQTQVEFNVEVSAIKCTDVKLENSLVGLRIDNTSGITLKPTITPIDSTDLRVWSSESPEVATVSNTGVVKPVSYGTSIIKLAVGDKEVSCIVRVCAPASSINLDKYSATLIIGNQMSIDETLNYSTTYSGIKINYPDVVVWSSSDPSVATVDSSGNVQAIKSGKTKISAKASAGGISKTCEITVIPETTDISFDKSEMTLTKGDANETTKTITMTLSPADSPLDVISVTSSNRYVASVSVSGNILTITAKGGGVATITATPVNGKAAVCNVKVISPITSITTKPMEINKGSSRTIPLVISPISNTDKVSYFSDNSAIATVDINGRVTGVAAGKATITIKSELGLVITTCVVTVTIPVTGVTFINKSSTLIKKEHLQLEPIATVQPSDASNKSLTWSSNMPSVASVDINGVVTAVEVGTAIITVRTVGGTFSATYTVNVNLPSLGGKNFDINNSGNIDILDCALVANGYNKKSGDNGYDTKFDLNSDNIIDIYDIVLVKRYMD